MSKYNNLKEQSDGSVFKGSKLVEQLSSFNYDNGVTVIQGLPSCPECGKLLTHEYLKNEWYCSGCGTGWDETSLIEALQNKRAVEKLHEED